MRGTTLGALIQMLRRELRMAESAAMNKNTIASHTYALQSAQKRLFDGYDWPIKNIKRDIPLKAGERYYAPPSDIDLENIGKIETFYGNTWVRLCYGIGQEQLNYMNSDADIRQDQALRWDFYRDNDNGDMIEIWPMPATDNVAVARISGLRKLSPLIADADKCDLDDLLIVLYAAADLVPKDGREDARAKAQSYFLSQRRKLNHTETFIMGGGVSSYARGPTKVIVTPGGS